MAIEVVRLELDTKAMDRWIDKTGQSCDQAIKGMAEQVLGEAVAIVPVRTGNLKNSLNVQKQGEAEYIVQDGTEYGIFVELGTKYIAARPYLIPAMEKVRNIVAGEVQKELEKI